MHRDSAKELHVSTLSDPARGLTVRYSPGGDAEEVPPTHRFRTLRGVRRGIRGQSNFFVYFFFIALALVGAVALDATLADWCVLTLCVSGALAAEMFRCAIAAVASPLVDQDPRCAEGVEIAGAAVLIAVLTACAVATVVFAHRFGVLVGWWG